MFRWLKKLLRRRKPVLYKRVIFGPFGKGILEGRYMVEKSDGCLSYVFPPIKLEEEQDVPKSR